MERSELVELETIHAKELAVLAHDIFKVTYEDKLHGKFEKENFKTYLKNAFAHIKVLEEIQDPNSRYFGHFEEGKMIAYLKVNFLSNQSIDHPDNCIEVERLYVSPEWQGKGLGSYMLQWISDWAKERSYVKLWLRSWEKNEEAIAFYKKKGMVITGTAAYKFEEATDVDYVLEIML